MLTALAEPLTSFTSGCGMLTPLAEHLPFLGELLLDANYTYQITKWFHETLQDVNRVCSYQTFCMVLTAIAEPLLAES